MEDHLKWLRGPLPPLSDSIVSSGLVNDPRLQVLKAPDNQQAIWGSMNPTPKQKKSSLKHPKVQDPKPRKESKSKLDLPPAPIIPPAELPHTYKPQPIETFSEMPLRSRVGTDKGGIPICGEPKRANLRSEVEKLTQQLDAAVAEIAPLLTSCTTVEQHSEVKRRLVQVYNFIFNQLIIIEKDNCSDKALLLRRFQKFYNQIFDDIPSLCAGYENEIAALRQQNTELETRLSNEISIKEMTSSQVKQLHKEIAELKEKLSRETEKSNQKDIDLQNLQDERDFSRGLLAQTNFKLESKDAEIAALKQAISQRDSEIQRQLQSIDENQKKMYEMNSGETGYIVQYHEELKLREKAEAKVAELNQVIYDLTHIPKEDQCVDTSDLPVKKSKKKKNVIPAAGIPMDGGRSKGITPNTTSTSVTLTDSNNTSTTSTAFTSVRDLKTAVSDNADLDDRETQTECSETAESSVQTDPIVLRETHSDDDSDVEELSHELNVDEVMYDTPEGYNVDHKAVDSLPDLLPTLTSFFSRSFAPAEAKELLVVHLGLCSGIVTNDKPLVWAHQIIHNFLTDPYIRSIENQSKVSLEAVFVDWLKIQYKLTHLVNQIVADFSHALMKYHDDDLMIRFFGEILESRYTWPTLCFIGTLYSFTVSYTFPNILGMLQTMNMEPGSDPVKIHVAVAFKVIAKCFSPNIANGYLRGKVTMREPLLNYVDFLRQSAYFFNDKHQQLFLQTKNLLMITGCPDINHISFDQFSCFFSFVDKGTDFKKRWKLVMSRKEDKSANTITLSDLLIYITEKRETFLQLLSFNTLAGVVANLQKMPPILFGLHENIVQRFCHIIPHVLAKVPEDISSKLAKISTKVREAILTSNLPNMLWFYKLFLLKTDQLCMKAKGKIPLAERPTSEQIDAIEEYYNREESVALAFINV